MVNFSDKNKHIYLNTATRFFGLNESTVSLAYVDQIQMEIRLLKVKCAEKKSER